MIIVFYLIIFLFGLTVGSFLNCIIYRLALQNFVEQNLGGREKKGSFLKGRSFCPYCKHTLNWQDLIPLLSFLVLKRKCRYCQKKISWQYPLVELATALLFVFIFSQIVVSQGAFTASMALWLLWLFLVSCFLIIIFVYDSKHYIIPDKVIYPAIGIALIYNFYKLLTTHYSLSTILTNFYAALGAALFFLLIILISRGRWMGWGDVKLVFFMGLFLGFPKILVALFLSFFIGAIIGVGLILVKKKELKSEIPFGPFLVAGTFIALFWGQELINWYLKYTSLLYNI